MNMSGEARNRPQALRFPIHDDRRRARTGFPRWLKVLVATSLVALVACSNEPPAQGSQPSDAGASPEEEAQLDPGPTILAEGSEALPARWMGIAFWDVDEVFRHPCDAHGTIQPDRTVADLVSALAEQPLRDATPSVDVVIDGLPGVRMEWSVPADFDFSTCDDGYFDSWTAVADSWNGGRYQQVPGQVDRLWIFDVGGERLVVDAMYMPSADAADRKELWQVMESIRFQT